MFSTLWWKLFTALKNLGRFGSGSVLQGIPVSHGWISGSEWGHRVERKKKGEGDWGERLAIHRVRGELEGNKTVWFLSGVKQEICGWGRGKIKKVRTLGDFPRVHWLSSVLPLQGTLVPFLVEEHFVELGSCMLNSIWQKCKNFLKSEDFEKKCCD